MRRLNLYRTVRLSLRALVLHKLRSGLTVLGIVFGVASVIAMLSIGEGASREAQDRIRGLGSQNIILNSQKPPDDQTTSSSRSRMSEYGLTYDDAERIETTFPGVDVVVPVRDVRKEVSAGDLRTEGRILGTVPWHPRVTGLTVARGRFILPEDMRGRANVAVIGPAIAREVFPLQEPIGSIVRLGLEHYRVVGVIEDAKESGSGAAAATDRSRDVYIPLTTAQERLGGVIVRVRSGSRDMERVELHQIQVRVDELERVEPVANAIRAMIGRYHRKQDVEIVVPLELLRQAQETRRIFNIVLGSIAAISLLVGGIGIMNIMLATVTERTREIGIRRALGAHRSDIVVQFLLETVTLSLSGGVLGIAVGVAIPLLVTRFAGMRTAVTPFSLGLAFGISAAVGVLFGLYPAWNASRMDPIEALRHE